MVWIKKLFSLKNWRFRIIELFFNTGIILYGFRDDLFMILFIDVLIYDFIYLEIFIGIYNSLYIYCIFWCNDENKRSGFWFIWDYRMNK